MQCSVVSVSLADDILNLPSITDYLSSISFEVERTDIVHRTASPAIPLSSVTLRWLSLTFQTIHAQRRRSAAQCGRWRRRSFTKKRKKRKESFLTANLSWNAHRSHTRVSLTKVVSSLSKVCFLVRRLIDLSLSTSLLADPAIGEVSLTGCASRWRMISNYAWPGWRR